MCDFEHGRPHQHFGFLVDNAPIRALVEAARQASETVVDIQTRVDALRPAFATLLAADDWLPDEYAQPDLKSGMGGGIGQYALYRAQDGSLCLFSLVIPPGVSTPVHDHLAWGVIGVYRGRQEETIYRRLDVRRARVHLLLPVVRGAARVAGSGRSTGATSSSSRANAR